MESLYKKYNNITGWLVFAIAAFVYCTTVEPTASFWDCGEFISTAFKLEVGHPPGAPFWMLIARVFALFAGDDVTRVAYWINIFSALCSAFAMLFLFWTTTALAKKLSTQGGAELTKGKILGIVVSGFIGAVAYTFTDTVWFSAVEGEVYSASLFFTAIVFWLILKWDALADEKYADRYLILIAYLMGLSIGVHLLNLLSIPAVVYVYYFRKTKQITPIGFIKAGAISLVILAFVQYGIIQSFVAFMKDFELFFTNTLGMPFHSGTIAFVLLVVSAIVAGIIYARKKRSQLLHTAFVSVAVILIGYSSFLTIPIRSAANTPLDENNPENVFALLPYLNREQYGDRPLFYGQTFNSIHENGSPILDPENPYKDEDPTYYKDEQKNSEEYLLSDDGSNKGYNFHPKVQKFFPRMYSTEDRHREAYNNWLDFKKKRRGKKVDLGEEVVYLPTAADDMEFFARYQFNFMYWRYFMWNFAGRQNDLQASNLNESMHGNWVSGFDVIDKEHVGDTKNLPAYLKNNKGHNVYYFLPLILAIIGLIYHFTRSVKDAFIVFLMFFMTGLAIIIYLNQPPFQPRERDYAYVGSFYAFAVWIGLGVHALIHFMRKFKKEDASLPFLIKLEANSSKEVVLAGISGVVLGVLAYGMDAKEVGYSLMFIGAVVAVLPIVCMYLGQVVTGDSGKAIAALGLTFCVPYVLAAENWDDHDRSNRYTARDIAKCYLESCAKNAIVFTNGDNDTFPLWYVQEVEGFRTDVRVVNLSLLNTDWYIDQMRRKAYDSDAVPFSLTPDHYRARNRDVVYILNPMDENYKAMLEKFTPKDVMAYYQNMWNNGADIDDIVKLIASDEAGTKLPGENPEDKGTEFITTRKITIKVDSAAVIANGTVSKDQYNQIPKEIQFSLGGGAIYKSKLMVLDLIATNNWERPIYFSSTVGQENFFGLQNYFRKEGLCYRLTPIATTKSAEEQRGDVGTTNSAILYNNLMTKFSWGNMQDTSIYIDEQNYNLSYHLGSVMQSLAAQLIVENKKDSAEKVLDKIVLMLPNKNYRYDERYMLDVAENYFQIDKKDKGLTVFNTIKKNFFEEFNYFQEMSISRDKFSFDNVSAEGRLQYTQQRIQRLMYIASIYKLDDKLIKELESKVKMPQ